MDDGEEQVMNGRGGTGREQRGGTTTTLLATSQYGMHKDTAEVVQQHLAAIGIVCELQLPDWSTRVSRG